MKYTVKHSTGKEFTRNSKRTYTHAVIWSEGSYIAKPEFCGSHNLAVKAANRLMKDNRTVEIVEVAVS